MFVKWNKGVYDRFNKIFDIKVYPLERTIESESCYSYSNAGLLSLGKELDFRNGYNYSEEDDTICENVMMKVCYIYRTSNIVMSIPDELFYILEEPLERVPIYNTTVIWG